MLSMSGGIDVESKDDILKAGGTYNRAHKSVTADEFQHGVFFDPKDLAQVKYEMLRSVAKDGVSISDAAEKYGLSRQPYYISKNAVENQGLVGLIPQKRGPKGSHKLGVQAEEFIDRYMKEHPNANSAEINRELAKATGIQVHNRTVSRYMAKK